ncbi:MAG: hypothetical protein EOP56_10825 [Sphingobacteriales bacterium]|nr:MAG: hypothetical protein EOP56_10825 [Sphingobacteriales bacterium]
MNQKNITASAAVQQLYSYTTAATQQHNTCVTPAQQQHNSTFTAPLQHRTQLSFGHYTVATPLMKASFFPAGSMGTKKPRKCGAWK